MYVGTHDAHSLEAPYSANERMDMDFSGKESCCSDSQLYTSHQHQQQPPPQQPMAMYDDLPPMPRRSLPKRAESGGGSKGIPLFFVAFLILSMGAIYTSRDAVSAAAAQVRVLEQTRQQLDHKLKEAEADLHSISREMFSIDSQLEKKQAAGVSQQTKVKNLRALHEMNALQKRVQEEVKQSETLKRKVQASSSAAVREKYGEGPHYVEMELVFDDPNGPSSFIMEMAPLSAMPLTVHTFLEMVDLGLLNGCSFILNAMHVIKEAPLPYDGSSAKLKAKEFAEAGLEHIAFKEYNETYPHLQYTVGFAADGSPSFYINTDDNTEIHIGDPCFGKVVEGIEVVKRLEACPTRNGIWFEKRIGIKRAHILKDPQDTMKNQSSATAAKLRSGSHSNSRSKPKDS